MYDVLLVAIRALEIDYHVAFALVRWHDELFVDWHSLLDVHHMQLRSGHVQHTRAESFDVGLSQVLSEHRSQDFASDFLDATRAGGREALADNRVVGVAIGLGSDLITSTLTRLATTRRFETALTDFPDNATIKSRTSS